MSQVDYKALIRQQQNVINNLLSENKELTAALLKARQEIAALQNQRQDDAQAASFMVWLVQYLSNSLTAQEVRINVLKGLNRRILQSFDKARQMNVTVIPAAEFNADLRGD